MMQRFGSFLFVLVCVCAFSCSALMGAAWAQDQSILQAPVPVDASEQDGAVSRSVFGAHLFNGAFSERSISGFNADYELAVGDVITLTLWGGVSETAELALDAQGNVFIPNVGPLRLLGVKSGDLNTVVSTAIQEVYKKNVGVYASLNGAEKVKVFVTGFVANPGLYESHSSDSILSFLDKAGGIDPARGSYLNVVVRRSGAEFKRINLYDFVLTGHIPVFQIRDGDTLVVEAVGPQVDVTGDVHNAYRFEFAGPATVGDVLALASPFASATHVRIDRNSRAKDHVEYLPIAEASAQSVDAGDRIEVVSDKRIGTISVRVEGEHNSIQEYVLPYGASLADLMGQVDIGANAEAGSLQLLRTSVKARQKELLEARLRALEQSVLTARSSSANEAQLRKIEAELILQWLDRARQVEPRGQVTLAGLKSYKDLLLEPGDIIRIPRKSNLISVHGDVLFPSSIPYQDKFSVMDYVEQAGGLTQPSSASTVLILHRDGTFLQVKGRQIRSHRIDLRPGDEILILPRVQVKSFQLAKDIFEVIYQLALSAGVVLGI